MLAIRRLLLWVLTTAIPVFIAACYGVAYNFARATGRVTDALTGDGIGGIELSCMNDGEVQSTAYTAADGSFILEYDDAMPCDTILVEDVDGDANGTYAPASVPMQDGEIDVPLARRG